MFQEGDLSILEEVGLTLLEARA